MRKYLLQVVSVFPRRIARWCTAPTDKDLRHRTMPFLMNSELQHLHRNLKDIVRSRQLRSYLLMRANTLLQLRNMEDRVNFACRRQLQLVSNLPNSLQYMKWAKELERKLVILTTSDGLLYIRLQSQEHFITDSKLPLSTFFVGLHLHSLLHPQQVLASRFQNQGTLVEPSLNVL